MTTKRTIRWVISHYPVHLFVRTAEKFRDELEKELPGQFDVEILTMRGYAEKYGKYPNMKLSAPNLLNLEHTPAEFTKRDGTTGTVAFADSWKDMVKKWSSLFDGLSNGDFEISQTQVGIVGHYLDKNFSAIDLPFLFEDHDHVSRVLDGDIGMSMCEDLGKKTNIRGLAFTYSGGYRVIGANHEITNLSELANAQLMTHTPISDRLFNAVGANVIDKFKTDLSTLDADDQNAVETTYLRFSGNHVYKTNHSMFTTTILTGNGFWNTLTEDEQAAFMRVAKTVAVTERAWSIADAEQYEQQAAANGITINEISEQDRAQLQEASQYVYANLGQLGIDSALVDQITQDRLH